MTKLHVVTASVQFSVCDIFTRVHAHGYGACLWNCSNCLLVGGKPACELGGRMCVPKIIYLESGHLSLPLPSSFGELKKKKLNVSNLNKSDFLF